MAKSDKSAGIASDSAAGTQTPQTEALAAASRLERYNLLRPSAGTQTPQITGRASQLDTVDKLMQKLAHLKALLLMTYGDAGDSFRDLHDDDQDNYLWHCEMLTRECAELAEKAYSQTQGRAQ